MMCCGVQNKIVTQMCVYKYLYFEEESLYAKVSFPAKSVSEISLENKGTNKIAVDFGNKNTTEQSTNCSRNIKNIKK